MDAPIPSSSITFKNVKRKVSFSQDLSRADTPSNLPNHSVKINPIDEQFISQIVLTPTPLEQPLANVLRSVFAAGRAEAFMDTLTAWSEKKETEIEAVCAEGYGLFVPTVETVLGRVRETSSSLETTLTTLRQEISTTAQQVYDTRVERFESKKMMLNVGKAICGIEDSLRALNLLLRIQMEIADGHEHGAVKLIDELQGKGALRAIEEMPFYPQVLASLESAKKSVWDAATGQVKAFLSTVRDQSIVMGSLALSQLQSRFEQFQRQEQQKHFDLFLADLAAEDAEMITSNDLVKIDFGPLQSALRLFSTMDRRGELVELLIETRRVQLELILGSRVNLERPDSDSRSLRTFLNSLTGFFIFERHLTRLPLAIYPLAHMESGWETAQGRIREIALDSLRLSASDRAAFMKIKWQLVFFTHALEMFNFPSNQLVDTILTLFYRYADLLRVDAQERCAQSIEKDSFLTNGQSLAVLAQRLLPRLLAQNTPSQTPSAVCLVECVNTIHASFLQPFTVFLEGIPGSADRSCDFSELARKIVDHQILPSCAKSLALRLQSILAESAIVKGATTSSSAQLALILCVLNDFRIICAENGDLAILLLNFSTTTTTAAAAVNTTSEQISEAKALNSAQIFKETLDKSYSTVVDDLLQEDLQLILSKLSYDRTPKQLFAFPSAPIQELLLLLGNMKENAKELNVQAFWCPIMDSIVEFFDTKILSDVKYPHLSVLFFKNLAIDLEALNGFFQPILESSSTNTNNSLSGLLEICALLQAESVHEYLDPVVRKRKYSNVQSERIVSVLGKLTEPADKRQSVEDLILLLK